MMTFPFVYLLAHRIITVLDPNASISDATNLNSIVLFIALALSVSHCVSVCLSLCVCEHHLSLIIT